MEKSFFLFRLSMLFLLIFSGVFADVYMKQRHHVGEINMMGSVQPAQDFIVESWITPKKMAVKNQGQDIIVDMDKGLITVVDHTEKTISEIPLDFSKIMAENIGGSDSMDMEELQEFMGNMMQVNFKVIKTSEKKKIGNWDCTKYIQTMELGMGAINSVIWATSDIKIDDDIYARYSANMIAQMPGASQEMSKILEEIRKIDGVQVYMKQTTNMMGQSFSSTMELIEFKEGNAPEKVFFIPSDYKKVDLFRDN